MTDVLLIGCGDVGAGYDWDQPGVLSHAKALATSTNVLSVFDPDSTHCERVATRYGATAIDVVADLAPYDLVVIASPTTTHESYLLQAFEQGVPAILCEKPITATRDSLARVEAAYHASSSRVLVNFIRRFQPAFLTLRQRVAEIEPLAVSITYGKGFLNYASHALDLLTFLFPTQALRAGSVSGAASDVPLPDRTLSGAMWLGDAPVHLNGIPHISYPVFRLDLFFPGHQLRIANGGHELTLSEFDSSASCWQTVYHTSDALEDYMRHVHAHVEGWRCESPSEQDEFLGSIALHYHLFDMISMYHED